MALLPLCHAGRMHLRGADSELTMNGATISASCGQDPFVNYIHANKMSNITASFRLNLHGVAIACADEPMSQPCAQASSSLRPPAFHCIWCAASPCSPSGPHVANAPVIASVLTETLGEGRFYNPVPFATVDCDAPSYAAAATLLGVQSSSSSMEGHSLTLALVHFVQMEASETLQTHGKLLPYRGAVGGDSFGIPALFPSMIFDNSGEVTSATIDGAAYTLYTFKEDGMFTFNREQPIDVSWRPGMHELPSDAPHRTITDVSSSHTALGLSTRPGSDGRRRRRRRREAWRRRWWGRRRVSRKHHVATW